MKSFQLLDKIDNIMNMTQLKYSYFYQMLVYLQVIALSVIFFLYWQSVMYCVKHEFTIYATKGKYRT